MKCEYCDNPVPNGVMRCPSCGAVVATVVAVQCVGDSQQVSSRTNLDQVSGIGMAQPVRPLVADQQSRVGYIFLGLFLGDFGLHNFYAGYVARGVVQLLLTIASFGLLCWISWLWAVIEIITVSKNAKGVEFR